jgi:dethiobiotin synthetase
MPKRLSSRGLFVTGTDTGVGKTVVSAALMCRYRRDATLRYWKPIQTGIEQDDDTTDVAKLAECRADEVFTSGIRLPRAVSPHLAARLSGTTIAIEPIVETVDRAPEHVKWIVEGAGGVLVPLNTTKTMIDLMVALGLTVIVAARTTLGTLNHTLLTLEALRRRHLDVAGVVMVGDRDDDNREAIERYGDVTIIGEMPRFPQLTAAALNTWSSTELDRDGRLLKVLQ